MSLDPSTNSGGRGHRILGGECLKRGGRSVEKSYNLTESHGGEGNDEEDRGTHVFFFLFFRVVNCLVKEGKGWCVDIIKKPSDSFSLCMGEVE